MAYDVTPEYYEKTFLGEPVSNTDFPSLLLRASEVVEEMSMYRLNDVTFLSMDDVTKERIKKAVCAQIEYLDANGGSDMDNGVDLQSVGLGKFNYTKASGMADGSHQSIYAPRAIRYLIPTGLLYRGGGCY